MLDHPSDIPRLRSIHVTNGYREGIAIGKEQHLQIGFDEGYSLGAELGLRAGWCLGVLEGLMQVATQRHAESSSTEGQLGTDEALQILREAESELKVENLCGKEWFGEDGVWSWEVSGVDDEHEAAGAVAGEPRLRVAFDDVAAAHPIIKKWREKACEGAGGLGLVIQ